MFILAMSCGSYWLAVAGEVLHGLGSGTVMVAQRAVVSKFFLDNELTFALGVTVGVACISKTLAKASVAPIAEYFSSYMAALWYVCIFNVLSLVAGCIYARWVGAAADCMGMDIPSPGPSPSPGPDSIPRVGHPDFNAKSLLKALKRSTAAFWVLTVLHTLFLCAYHLFSNFSGHFMVENYRMSPVTAGYVSALMPLVVVFCAPLAGLVLDYMGYQIYVLLGASVTTTLGYILLLKEQINPAVCIIMLALCESFVPTILLSGLPLTVDHTVYGAAFGMCEVFSALGNVISNYFFGLSRDRTASYKADIISLVVICVVCLALTLYLLVWDSENGGKLNQPRKRYGFTSLTS
ncbi:unnamed protein product [Discosporangium mesarthrocarpum]